MKRAVDPNGYVGFILITIFILFYTFDTLGWAFISGHSNYWLSQNPEFNQHLSGISLYVSAAWQFPLLAFDSLNYPKGTCVTFLDGIPLFAFLLKLFLPRNMGFINPLGYWVALNFLFQGLAAWWITRELRVKSWAFLLFLVVTLLAYPAWLDRLRQIALMSHWLILFAIALYIRGCRQQRISKWGWTALMVSAFYIHVYLAAMVFGIYLAAIFDTKQPFSNRYLCSIALPFVVLIASLFVFLLPLPPALNVGGHLAYAMDLLSPFYGGKFIQLQANLAGIIKDINYNYLGLGVIVIFLWSVFFQSSKNYATIKKHPAFFIILVLCVIYSLSDKVCFGGNLVAKVSYSSALDPITMQFRAAERFFWPVGYSIVIFSLYRLFSQLKRSNFTTVVLFLLIVQWIDVGEYYTMFKKNVGKSPVFMLDYSALDIALGKPVKYIYLYPKYQCSKNKGRLPYPGLLVIPLMRYTAERNFKLNTGYIARYGSNCNDTSEEIAQSNKSESAYIFSKLDYKSLNQVLEAFQEKNHLACQSLDAIYVCRYQEKTLRNPL